jgi:RimJ/RimL family protein N-acetyltransferase
VSAVPLLETERLRLRGWRDDDVDPYAALCADPDVMRWLGANGATKTREESARQLEEFRRHWDEHGFGLWCAAPLETDECVGFIGLAVPTFLPEILPAVEIGWRLARPSWGQGLATEGARRTAAYAFDDLGLDRIVSITRPPNRSSWNVMQKIGMTLERTTVHPEHGFEVVVYELAAPGTSA